MVKNEKTARAIRLILFAVYVFFILWVTLLSRTEEDFSGYTFELVWTYKKLFAGDPQGPWWVKQNIGNVLFFIPLGLLFPGKKKWGLVCGIALSVLTEVLQVVCRLGYGELDDVICNTVGTVIGLWGAHIIAEKIRESAAKKRRMNDKAGRCENV